MAKSFIHIKVHIDILHESITLNQWKWKVSTQSHHVNKTDTPLNVSSAEWFKWLIRRMVDQIYPWLSFFGTIDTRFEALEDRNYSFLHVYKHAMLQKCPWSYTATTLRGDYVIKTQTWFHIEICFKQNFNSTNCSFTFI